ncbi:MAG: hypothetical protein QM786_00375 [Breznakibacter sp.]
MAVPGSGEAANSSTVGTPSQSGIYGCTVDIKPIAWKSIPAGGTDYIQVEIKGDCAIDSLRYLRASGLPVPPFWL